MSNLLFKFFNFFLLCWIKGSEYYCRSNIWRILDWSEEDEYIVGMLVFFFLFCVIYCYYDCK